MAKKSIDPTSSETAREFAHRIHTGIHTEKGFLCGFNSKKKRRACMGRKFFNTARASLASILRTT